jgi:hypothetical protein
LLKTGAFDWMVRRGPADKIWLTCCALHNWLLEADGLDDWASEKGQNDVADMNHAPFLLQHLQQEEFVNFGSSSLAVEIMNDQQQRKDKG